jgi:hypothetical protein
MASEITNSPPISPTQDRLCVQCNDHFPVPCFVSENGMEDSTLCNKHETERAELRCSRRVVVDLVRKRDCVNTCMVQCPCCGNVNHHGLGSHETLFLWGHRGCDGGNGCSGYVLAPAAVVKKASDREWRKLSKPLLKIQKDRYREKCRKNRIARYGHAKRRKRV